MEVIKFEATKKNVKEEYQQEQQLFRATQSLKRNFQKRDGFEKVLFCVINAVLVALKSKWVWVLNQTIKNGTLLVEKSTT